MAKQNKPAIRFKGFTDAWEQRKLGEVVERITRKNENLESTLPLTISAQYGLINQNEFFDKRIASKDVSGYFLVRNGEFAYNKSTSSDAPWGAIKRLDRYESGVLSTLYIVFKILDERKTSSDYIVTYYNTDLWHKGIQAIAAEGARNHGLLNVAPADFFETNLTMPKDYAEQQQIGSFFQQLDHLITLHQRKFDKLQVLKKAMLEKMFPKNGSSVPEIRFKGFTDAWEQRKLGEFFEKYQNTVYLQDEEEYRQISIRNTGVVEYRCTNKGKNIGRKRQYLIDTDTHPVTLTFTRQTVYEGGIGFVPKELNGAIVTENMPLLEMTNASQDFMKALFNTSGYYKSVINDDTLIGSAQKALHEKQWLDSYVCIPVLDEQKQIGSFFQQLEHLITLHQRELEKLQNIKKSMLEKMFV